MKNTVHCINTAMAEALANSKRYRFHSLEESDYCDIIDGIEFIVHYVGCTYITEDYEISSETEIEDFFKNVVTKYPKNQDKLQVILKVNKNGAIISDNDGHIRYSFIACNISYVSRTSGSRYSEYLVIVARTPQEQHLKGHVLLCKTKCIAKRICQTFTKMFNIAQPVAMVTGDDDVTSDHALDSDVFEPETNSTFDFYAGLPSIMTNSYCIKNNNPSNDFQAIDNCEKLLDDGFTELAKSRSSSSSSEPRSLTYSGKPYDENSPTYHIDSFVFR